MSFLAYLNGYVVCVIVTFVTTLVFSQKIKDWIKGIPSSVRAELQKVESGAMTNLQALQVSAVHTALNAVSAAAPAAPPAPKA